MTDIILSTLDFHALDVAEGRPEALMARSPHWSTVRDAFLKEHAACAVCGFTKSLNVHHIRPFHADPARELDPANFITLGEACPGGNHHLYFGHLGHWESHNPLIVQDAAYYLHALRSSPVIHYPY